MRIARLAAVKVTPGLGCGFRWRASPGFRRGRVTRPTRDSISHWTLVLPALGFIAAISIQGIHFIGHGQKNRGPHLAQSVPAHVAGWSSRDVPLGQNEFLASEAEKVLNYDEVVYREFTRGRVTFGVYVAYWGAGKMPTRLVASHTPDRCWTENGWHCTAMKFPAARGVRGRGPTARRVEDFRAASRGRPDLCPLLASGLRGGL